jgi:hypothetical protein
VASDTTPVRFRVSIIIGLSINSVVIPSSMQSPISNR